MRPVLIDDDPFHPSSKDDEEASLSMEEGMPLEEGEAHADAPRKPPPLYVHPGLDPGAMSTPASLAARAGAPIFRSPLAGPDVLRAFRGKGSSEKLYSFEGKVLSELTGQRELISSFMRLSTGGFPVSLNPQHAIGASPDVATSPTPSGLNVGEGSQRA
jgi:hypothetical protein